MRRRMLVIMLVLTLMFVGVTGRLSFLMLGENMLAAASAQTSKTVTVTLPRGTVYDCNMVPLTNAQTRTLAVIPPSVDAVAAVTEQLSGQAAQAALESLQSGNPVLVEVPSDFLCADAEIYTVPVRYSENQIAAHVIGYLDGEGRAVTGIEYAYDGLLGGKEPLKVTYTVDAVGRPLSGVEPTVVGTPRARGGVVLTLDSRVQRIVERVASETIEKGAVIVMESATGRLLASCSLPTYSPYSVSEVLNDASAPLVNRVLSSYNIGSVFKICVAAAALKGGTTTMFTSNCTGETPIGSNLFHCHLLTGHGMIGMPEALAKSCNCYFIDLGINTGAEAIYDMCVRMGFNRAYSLAKSLTATAGTLPSLTELKTRPAALANLSFGQGDLMMTPLHVATMVAAVANGGYLVTPSIVEGTTDGEKIDRLEPAEPLRVLSQRDAELLRQMMCGVVEQGTGKAAKPEQYGAGGKTATAETGWVVDSKLIKQAWFAGFYPEDSGKYTIVVLRENGEGGAVDCAPVFKKIADAMAQVGLVE